jgi:hypothetical protein
VNTSNTALDVGPAATAHAVEDHALGKQVERHPDEPAATLRARSRRAPSRRPAPVTCRRLENGYSGPLLCLEKHRVGHHRATTTSSNAQHADDREEEQNDITELSP